MEEIIPKLTQEEFLRYQQEAYKTIELYPFIRYGQALVNAISKDYTVVFPELFYGDSETAESLQQLLLQED